MVNKTCIPAVRGLNVSGKLKESVSALIDDEASEIEVHRLLRNLDSEQDLKKTFFIYQQIRSVLRNPSDKGQRIPGVDQQMKLFQRIRDAIDEEETFTIDSPSHRHWLKPVAGLAVAATLLMTVGIVFNNGTEPLPDNISTNTPTIAQNVDTQPVEPGPELRELDEEKQKLLREYLNEHDRMTRLKGNTHLVNYPPGK